VGRHARRHERVGELEQNGPPPPEEHDPLAVDTPRHATGRIGATVRGVADFARTI
jgi:hypothetical protein